MFEKNSKTARNRLQQKLLAAMVRREGRVPISEVRDLEGLEVLQVRAENTIGTL